MITQADVNEFLNEFGINNNLMEKLIKESVAIELKENIKLKQALAEIKEIVSSTLDCGEWIGQGDNKMEQILNKISEVLDDTSNR